MNLTLNLIPFAPVESSKTFGFITEKREGYYLLAKYEIPKILFESHEECIFQRKWFFANFGEVQILSESRRFKK